MVLNKGSYMRNVKILIINKKIIYYFLILALLLLAVFGFLKIHVGRDKNTFIDPDNNIIVIDPGHGGIDGGAYQDSVLEKEINLDISKRLKYYLELKGYTVILTREEDISLDKLSNKGGSRHQRDLNARVDIINNSNAQLFISIHVNCNLRKPQTDGSIVFFNDKYPQNEMLAYSIQRALNDMSYENKKRTLHEPQKGDYFLLEHSKIPGVIVETAFLSNIMERELLKHPKFRDEIAKEIDIGVEEYFWMGKEEDN